MKQLSLMLLLVASCASFAMESPPPPPDEGDHHKGYDLRVEITESSPHSGERRTRRTSFHLLPEEDPRNNNNLLKFLEIVALNSPRAPRGSTLAWYGLQNGEN